MRKFAILALALLVLPLDPALAKGRKKSTCCRATEQTYVRSHVTRSGKYVNGHLSSHVAGHGRSHRRK
jgi:hypothetical protein